MKNIIVLIPTESESRFVIESGIRVSHCGAGMAECAATTARLITENRPDLMVLAGTAGTYTDDLMVGETVVVKSEVVSDLGRLSSAGEFTPLYQRTYNASVVPKGFKAVRSNTNNTAGGIIAPEIEADIENMEGAAFFAVCAAFGVPAMEVRTVSNRVGECICGTNMEISIHRLALDLEKIIAKVMCKEPREE